MTKRRPTWVVLRWLPLLAALGLSGCTSEDDPAPAAPPAPDDAGADSAPLDAGSDSGVADADAGDDGGSDAAPVPPPFVMGHRGGAHEVPENTLAAFAHAIDHGINPEMDVRLSLDEQVVVIHDDTVDRTTDGSGAVADLSLVALQQLDAGSHFDAQYAGERIPTIDEVFELFLATAPATMIMSIDTKVESETMYDRVIASLGSHDLFTRAYIEVSSPDIAEQLRARPGGLSVRLAIWVAEQGAFDEALAYGPFERVHCAASLAGRGDDAHAVDKVLIPGLINDEADWSAIQDEPIDGINSNAPVYLKEQVLGR